MATTPICRCRVLYLGSAVPHVTKDGLQGIQEPLKDLYPEAGPLSARGIDSWLSVWSNGLLLENVDESQRQHTRFFPIETLHYCAAVRYVIVPNMQGGRAVEKFLPLDSPFARHAGPSQPPVFACILRRTTGIKVLECHAFICKKEQAANALVRCCFHAYADCTYAKQMEENPYASLAPRRSKSAMGLEKSGHGSDQSWRNSTSDTPNEDSILLDDETDTDDFSNNYKVWNGPSPRDVVYSPPTETGAFNTGTLRSIHSTASRRPRQLAQPTSAPPPPPLPPPMLPPMERGGFPHPGVGAPHPGIPPIMGGPPQPNSKKELHTLKKLKAKDKSRKKASKDHQSNGVYPVYPMIAYPPPSQHHAMYGGRRGPPLFPYEEPVYLPNMRPISPVASYQPGGFPHEQYFMQYGTAPRPATAHGTRPPSRAYKKQSASSSVQQQQQQQQQQQPHHHHHHHHHQNTSSSAESSPFNTGIYRKKGHLNERAFSHSIRQEHRSRSNSVAALDFDVEDIGDGMQAMDLGPPPPPPPAGHPVANGNGYGPQNGYGQVYGHALVEADSRTIEKKTQKKKEKKAAKEKR